MDELEIKKQLLKANDHVKVDENTFETDDDDFLKQEFREQGVSKLKVVTAEEKLNGDNYIFNSDADLDLENLACNGIKQSSDGEQSLDRFDLEKGEIGQQKIEIKENDGDISQYHVFGDGDRLFRRYPLRQPKPKGIDIQKRPPKPQTDNSDNEINPLECETCHAAFQSKTGLLNHMRMHEWKTVYLYTCLICSESFETNINLISHKNKHENENLTFLCKKCKLAFSNHLDYLLHKVKHMKNSVCRCRECGKVLKSKTAFTIHIQTHSDKRHECHICKKLFRGERNIKNHLKTHVNIVECGECGKRCKDASYLKYHMISHTGVKRHQCLYCGKGFSNNLQRQVHTRTHTDERPYECQICCKKFRQQIDYKRHMESHSSMKRYECEFCNKKYTSKWSLDTHRRVHTKSKLYPCTDCDKSFTTYRNLRSHMLFIHIKEKPHKCELCNLHFTVKNHLTRHFKSIRHKKKAYGETLKGKENRNNGKVISTR